MRIPRTSSFPSGHASSAFFAAVALRDSPGAPLIFAAAAIVAASRVHVRMHHASDVVAGALLGAALGELHAPGLPHLAARGTKRPVTRVERVMPTFSVTWDYLCPFARNAHEHLVTALQGGAEWDVSFRYFSLAQAHVPEGGEPVWSNPREHPGVLAGLAGLVVRDKQPERFLDAHQALFRPIR